MLKLVLAMVLLQISLCMNISQKHSGGNEVVTGGVFPGGMNPPEGWSDGNETDENGGGEIMIDQLSLPEICAIINYPLENCTCDNLPEFCLTKEQKYQFTCSFDTDLVEAIVKVIANILGLLGNYLVLHVAYIHRKKIGQYRKLIAMLALYDFIFSILSMLTAIPLFWTCKWVYGPFMCKLLRPALNLGSIVALGLIVIIAIERYYGIARPFEKKPLLKNFIFLNTMNILISIAIIIPLFVTLEINQDGRCSENWKGNKVSSLVYSWFLMIATFILPLMTISFFYYKILSFLHRQQKQTEGVFTNDKQQALNRIKGFRRITKILVAILVAYVVLVFPNRIVWVILDSLGTSNISITTYRILKYVGLFPYMFHVAINPIIYSAIDRKFRSEVKQVFQSKHKHRSVTTMSSLLDINMSTTSGTSKL